MSCEAAAPLGILGGTFDPVHWGHLALARAGRDGLGLAQVRWIPAGRPPHRGAPRASDRDRLAMVELAIAGEAGFCVDPGEVLSGAPSYTVPTLTRLRAECARAGVPARPLVLILGADAFAGLPGWYHWQEIFALAHLAVAPRPGQRLEADALAPPLAAEWRARHRDDGVIAGPAGSIVDLPFVPTPISATAIRERLAAGADSPAGPPLAELLPPDVVHYIHTHRLYGV